MLNGHYLDREFQPAPDVVGTTGAGLRWLTDESHGAAFCMRHVIIEEGGSVGDHNHPQEHQIFIIKGEGVCSVEGEECEMTEGRFLRVVGGVVHAFKNIGKGNLEFICCIDRLEEG